MRLERRSSLRVGLLWSHPATVEKHISVHGELEDTPTETTYEEFVQATEDIITAASHMAKTLTIIAEDIDLPEPGPIAGAVDKPRLGFAYAEKDEIVFKALVSASQILRSYFDTVQPLAAEIADILSETPED